MAFSVVMPALEMAQETGKLIAWRKKEGDRVSKGEPLLEIETDKAVVEVEAPADGVLAGIRASPGAEIPVGHTIAWIVAPGEQPPADGSGTAPAARAVSHTQPPPATAGSGPVAASDAGAKISPKARRLARELGVDLAALRGSGTNGEILASDVQAAAARAADASVAKDKPGSIEIPSSTGRIMAERTTRSWTTVPHFFVSRDIDATELNEYRERVVAHIERTRQVRVTHTDLLIAIVARVLLKHPRLNASWNTDGILLHDYVNMGVAIAVNDGVVAAVVHNAHTASIAEIAIQRRDMAERARAAKLRPIDIADATFTLSNLGMYKVDQFSAIITPPQAAILAIGAITERVVAREGKVALRPMMTVTASCDHRVIDGALASAFLADLSEALRTPTNFIA